MSPDRKHGREAAHRRAAAQAAARELHRRRQQRLRAVIGAVVAVAVVAGIAFSFAGGGDDDDASSSDASTTTSAPPTSLGEESTVPVGPFEYGTGACPPLEPPPEPVRTFADAPMRCLEEGKDYAAQVVTSEGSFTIDLLEAEAPGTVNNFVVLARYGFFDGLTFHRVVKGFMNQGGDPNGDGSGDPGYAIADELPAAGAYVSGAVAMANSGPNTNGSQFFTCVGCESLPPDYSLFGTVTEGMDVVTGINDLGVSDGPPSKPVTITSVTIAEQ